MTQPAEAVPPPPGDNGRWDWVEAWKEMVRVSPTAVGLVDLASMQFVALSPRGAELLGTTCEEAVGLDYLAMVEPRQDAELILRLLTAGALDTFHGRRRMRRRDGSVVELSVAGGAIRSPAGAGLGLWVATGVAMGEGPVEGADLLADLPGHLPSIEPEVARPAVGTLDDRWRVASLSADVEELLGHDVSEIIGSSIIDMTHPRDAADLLLAFVCATSHRTAYARVRLRDRHRGWQAVTLMVTLLDEEEGARFAFGIATNEEPQLSAGVKRLAELEDHLRRIAAEVRAAGVLRVRAPDADATRVPALSEMSARQWEVISRLARGEGVATIANEMYLSQSTVRNHLSAIFRKVGVHTQRELLALLRDGS